MKRFFIIFLCLMLLSAVTASASKALPYTVSLSAGEPIRTGPGPEYKLAQTLGEDGVFTIVEESYDSDVHLWGKLKSGAGWVQLSGNLPRTASLPANTAVYSAPGHNARIAQTIDENGVFTIIEETRDSFGNLWGKLKSGAGWVALNTCAYTIPLYSGTEIFEGPGYGFAIAKTLGEKGVFTIVEEAWDEAGNGWGRLKSGAGWVFLKSEQTMSVAPISAHYAEHVRLQDEPVRVIADTSEYAVDIVFIPHEDIRNISLSSLMLTDFGFVVDEQLFTGEELSAYAPLLASVAFPGDMSAYGFAFTDAGGNFRRYTVSISGMDGSLELIEQY